MSVPRAKLSSFLLGWLLVLSANVFANEEPLAILSVEIPDVSSDAFGREQIILKEMLACMGRQYEVTKVPYGRHFITYEQENFDLVTTIPSSATLKGYGSESHIAYTNGVSTLDSLNLDIKTIDDLKGLRVVSFVGASDQISGLKSILPELAFYSEVSTQESHSRMLFLGRVDAVISDGFIFHNYNKRLRAKEPAEERFFQAVKFHSIFDPEPFKLYFKQKPVKDKFDECLLNAKRAKYLDRLNYQYIMNVIMDSDLQ